MVQIQFTDPVVLLQMLLCAVKYSHFKLKEEKKSTYVMPCHCCLALGLMCHLLLIQDPKLPSVLYPFLTPF